VTEVGAPFPLEWEEAVFNAQEEWIEQNINAAAMRSANYGWCQDYVSMEISTKVYLHGVLTTDASLNHTWEPFK
jgi:hypothetical protein